MLAKEMAKNPELFQTLFVPTESEISAANVQNAPSFAVSLTEEQTTTKQWVLEYLQAAKVQDTQDT